MCVPLTDQVLCFQSKCDCLSQGMGGFCEVMEKESFIGLWGGVEHMTIRTLYLRWTVLLTEFSNTHACTCMHTHTHTCTCMHTHTHTHLVLLGIFPSHHKRQCIVVLLGDRKRFRQFLSSLPTYFIPRAANLSKFFIQLSTRASGHR